jgi:hypothetical protein
VIRDELIARHCELHRSLDELLACFIAHAPFGTSILRLPLGDFLRWSHEQTMNPVCEADHQSTGAEPPGT